MAKMAGLVMIGFAVVSAVAASARQHVPASRCQVGPTESLGPLVNSPVFDGSPTVSADETELFFTSDRDGSGDLFVSTRTQRSSAWTSPVNAGAMNDPKSGDFSLRLSADGRSLYFASNRDGGRGKADIYLTTRAAKGKPWSAALNVGGPLNTEAFEAFPTPSPDGRTLYFNRSTTFDSEDSDIWVSTRARHDAEWMTPQRLPSPINTNRAEFSPSLSSDGATMYFASARGGTIEIWMSRRNHSIQQWGLPERLSPAINAPGSMTLAPFVSSDHRSLYFMSARPGAGIATCTPAECFNRVDLYVASVTCR